MSMNQKMMKNCRFSFDSFIEILEEVKEDLIEEYGVDLNFNDLSVHVNKIIGYEFLFVKYNGKVVKVIRIGYSES